jgi:hypothetical protein
VATRDLKPGNVNIVGAPRAIRTVEIRSGITVRGEEPFTARFDGTVIKICTEGRARQFIVANLPNWLINAQFTLDGQEWLLSVR